jgi:hypothetical protein
MKQQLQDLAIAAEPPASSLTTNLFTLTDDEEQDARLQKRTWALQKVQAKEAAASAANQVAEQMLIGQLRSNCSSKRMQTALAFRSEEQLHRSAAARGVELAGHCRDVQLIVSRRVRQMLDTSSHSLNLDMEPALGVADVPVVLQCLGCATSSGYDLCMLHGVTSGNAT